MVILQHAFQDLLQVADLEKQELALWFFFLVLVKDNKNKRDVLLLFKRYFKAPVGLALLLDPAKPRLIKPRGVSVNENAELQSQYISLDIIIHRKQQQ